MQIMQYLVDNLKVPTTQINDQQRLSRRRKSEQAHSMMQDAAAMAISKLQFSK